MGDFSLLVVEKRRRKRKRKRKHQHLNQRKLPLTMGERKRRRREGRQVNFEKFHLADHYHHLQLLHDYTQLNIVYVFTILYKMFYATSKNIIVYLLHTIIDHMARKNLSICDDLHLCHKYSSE